MVTRPTPRKASTKSTKKSPHKAAKPDKRTAPRSPARKPPPRGDDGAAEAATIDPDERNGATPRANVPLTIVGVGASAGGLDAFSQLLRGLPERPGLALVLVQHQAPQHESALAELLAAQSRVPIVPAADGQRVERDYAYVCPPGFEIRIAQDGVLHLSARPTDRSQYVPIDIFLSSLAESAQDRAIAVILSGTGSDGTLGVRDVKAAGGITIAQRPETARYDGMPRAAIASGLIDLVLTPEEIGATLVQMGRHPYLLEQAVEPPERPVEREAVESAALMERILSLLRSGTGVDFRQYKRPTIYRRVHRRMVLHRLTRLDQYVRLLEQSPTEIQALFQDVLILVTRFFRDPEAFEALRTIALPRIFDAHREDDPIRIWVAGCSTGEEAYSVAMLLLEFMTERSTTLPVQIFATDVSEAGIDKARNGFYPASIASDVSPGRLRRFFTKIDGGYRISKTVRDMCVFARQDLIRDPPFSKLDLIVCRNVLIYLSAQVQQRLMSLFHYALKPTGYLLLGTAETIGHHSDFFAVEDKRFRLFAKKPRPTRQPTAWPTDYAVQPLQRARGSVQRRDEAHSVLNEANRVIQERYAPPGVVVDSDLQILQFRGHTGGFLEPAPGDPSMSLPKMVREGLLYGVRTAIQATRRVHGPVRRGGLRVKRNGNWHDCAIEVVPLSATERPHYLVLFHDESSPDDAREDAEQKQDKSKERTRRSGRRRERDAGQVARLEQELASSREYLQSIIQELEAANEELQSANEEVLSANEELQSTNEELDTAKEELQSTNEELNTVNDELRGRNEELSRVNSDLENLLASVQIAIVIVGRDLRIRRFTPMAERVLNLIPSDVGRPIGHIKPNVEIPDLEALITRVLDHVMPQEQEVRDSQGNWLSLRIRPYKDIENRIDGAVLTLFEINPADRQAQQLRHVQRLLESLIAALPLPVALLDPGMRLRSANQTFLEHLGASLDEAQGRLVWDVGERGPSLKPLDELLRDGTRIAADEPVRVPLSARFPGREARDMIAIVRRLEGDEGEDGNYLLALDDAK